MKSYNIRIRTIALPSEHGGWSLVLEPVVLGLLVMSSLAGFFLGLTALFLFLLRHPLRILIGDLKRKMTFPKTKVAGLISFIYLILSIFFFLIAILRTDINLIIPFLFASPFFIIYIIIDIFFQKKTLISEWMGPIALGSFSASIALAGEWTLTQSMVLWVVIILRTLPTISYVRARLELEKGENIRSLPIHLLHIFSILIASLLVYYDLLPLITILAFIILFIRSYIGLSDYRKPTYAQKIGLMEIGYGALTIFIIASGYIFHYN